MAEPTITLAYTDLAEEAGRYLGYGRTSANWSSDQAADVDACVQGGYRKFLFPMPIGRETEPHKWSFMTPTASLSTASADTAYDLPDDFGGLDGTVMTFSTDTGYVPIQIVSEAQVRSLLASADASGRTLYAAVRPKTFVPATGQRFELIVYPEPDAVYTITYRYIVMPNILSAGNPYPLGGPRHSETIMSAVLAFAEKRFNDEAGIYQEDFMTHLVASITLDRSINAPHNLGYNGDYSDGDHSVFASQATGVTYNGVSYS
jgi:hypothetical protein